MPRVEGEIRESQILQNSVGHSEDTGFILHVTSSLGLFKGRSKRVICKF